MNLPNKIILFHAGALGDLVNTLPAISALRERFAEASITAVGNREWFSLFKEAGVIDDAVSIERRGLHRLFGAGELSADVREFLSGFDLATSWVREPLLGERLRALGIKSVIQKDPFPPPPGSGHVSAYMARPLVELGVEVHALYPLLDLPPDASGPTFPGILIHPGSGSAAKNWPAPSFARAARRLAAGSGLPLAILEGPADRDPAGELAAELPEAMTYRELGPLELACLVRSAKMVVGNDSGVSHLAGSLGTAVVAVFGPTDPKIWGVRQERAVNLAPVGDEGMVEVGVDEVVEAALGLLGLGAER